MSDRVENSINDFYEYCSKYKKLAIYGAGDVGEMTAEFMEKENISFSCFCVTGTPQKHLFHSHDVKRIDEVMADDENTGVIVAVSKKNVQGILDLLNTRNIPYFYRTEFLYQLFRRMCRESAAKVFVRDDHILRISGLKTGDMTFSKDTLYICCPASIGDTLYVAAFVKAYKQEHPSVPKVCLLLKKGHRELGRIFPAVDEVLVSDEIVETLDRYSLYTQTWKLKNYLYGHFKKSDRFVYDPEYEQEGCRAILPRYRRLILDLSPDAQLEKIVLPKEFQYRNSLMAYPMKPHECIQMETAAQTEIAIHTENSKGNVVIMPYAKTAEMLPAAFWEELARRLRKTGYSIYTNVGNEKEKAVPGTSVIREPLLSTALFCEKCTAVISLRSGLCDLLGFTETRLIVLNTSEELSVQWNLNDVFQRSGIHHIDCYDKKDYGKVWNEIMKKAK